MRLRASVNGTQCRDEVFTEIQLPLERGRAGAACRTLCRPASAFALVGVADRQMDDARLGARTPLHLLGRSRRS